MSAGCGVKLALIAIATPVALGLAGVDTALAQAAQTTEQAPAVTSTRPVLPQAHQVTVRGAQGDQAYAAYQAGRFIEAFDRAMRRIEIDQNDAAAMTLLGELFQQGAGLRLNPVRAAEWYELAAQRGDRNAMFALAMMRLEGRGGARDESLARELLTRAAAAGHGAAAFNLALPLLASGGAAELEQAIPLLQLAAEQEIGDAQHALAVLMLEGRGVPRDEEAGADMMQRAAQNGSLAGEVEFAILQFTGRGIGRDERAAARGFARAAMRGNAIAQNRFARLLVQGRWVQRNVVEGVSWHLAARAQGLTDEFLDQEYAKLSPHERERAENLARDRIDDTALTRAGPQAQSVINEFKR